MGAHESIGAVVPLPLLQRGREHDDCRARGEEGGPLEFPPEWKRPRRLDHITQGGLVGLHTLRPRALQAVLLSVGTPEKRLHPA